MICIGLGYHEDLRTRTSFIEVLTSILKEGAQFSSLAETALADRLNQMLDLVTTETPEGDLPLVMALIDSMPPENVVSAVYHSHQFITGQPTHKIGNSLFYPMLPHFHPHYHDVLNLQYSGMVCVRLGSVG